MGLRTSRPVFLDLLKIRLPVTGVASVAHRAAGILLFLAIPFAVYLFHLSLHDAAGFATARHVAQSWPARLAALVLVWALAHHLAAGLRLLLIDADVGVGRGPARYSAMAVIAIGLAVLLLGVACL